MTFDGNGLSATGRLTVDWTPYDTFLDPAVSVTHFADDDEVVVTLWVRASTPAGDAPNAGSYGATQTITAVWVDGGSPPAAPTGLGCDAKTDSRIDLWWTDNANNELGYKIERKTGVSGTWAVIRTVDYVGYADNGLDPDTTYYYRVRAYNSDGYSAYSNEAYDTTMSAPAIPYPPVWPWASGWAYGVTIGWFDASSNEDGFVIERRLSSGPPTWSYLDTVGPAAGGWVTYNDTAVNHDQEYCYRVYAYNGNGNSAYTDPVCATVPP